jgi:hypothetical protein
MLAASPPRSKSEKRRRAVLTLLGISVGWKVIVFTVGAALPRWFMDDGIAAQPAELRPYARNAKRNAAALWNGRIERYGVVRLVRVVSVDRPEAATAVTASSRCGGLGARVKAYTYFGVPYSEARMTCDSGVVEYRVFRGRGQGRPVPLVVPGAAPAIAPVTAPASVSGEARGGD